MVCALRGFIDWIIERGDQDECDDAGEETSWKGTDGDDLGIEVGHAEHHFEGDAEIEFSDDVDRGCENQGEGNAFHHVVEFEGENGIEQDKKEEDAAQDDHEKRVFFFSESEHDKDVGEQSSKKEGTEPCEDG